MSIDVRIRIEQSLSDALVRKIEDVAGVWEVHVYNHANLIVVEMNEPWFGPDYERGDWPKIRKVIDEVMTISQADEMRYADSSEAGTYGVEVTDELIASLDVLWNKNPRSLAR